MIKIINGVFGYNNGKSIIPKTSKDEPFECDKAVEKRLVTLGVAKYVTTADVEVETISEVETDTDEKEVTREELIAQFKELGLKGVAKSMKTETLKAKIAEAIKAKDDEVETDEDAPSFEEDGVVD